MSVGDDRTAGGAGDAGRRILRFAIIGALIGAVAFVVKVSVADSFEFDENWIWALLVLLGAVAGVGIGLVLSGVGQSDRVD